MVQFLVANPIITACIWAALYIFDYSATLWLSRPAQQFLSQYFTYEGGMEMNPVVEKEVAVPRLASSRFLVLLCLFMAILILCGSLDPAYVSFEFMVGAFLLLWTFIDLRHLRNLYFYFHLKKCPEAVEGHIRQSYWLNQRLVSFDALKFSVVYGLAWLGSGKQFFLGGMFVCFMLALWHFFLANRKPKVHTGSAPRATKNEWECKPFARFAFFITHHRNLPKP